MKLTAHTFRVKPPLVTQLFLVSLLSGLGVLLLLAATADEEARMEQFGASLAQALASQVIEPLLARDLIHLGVLANRMAAVPEVTGASIHGMDNEPLALSGDVRRGRSFPAQVVHNDRSVGVVRVHLDPAAFASGLPVGTIALGLLWMSLVPVLVGLMSRVNVPSIRSARRPASAAASQGSPPEPPAEPEAPEVWHLLTMNLFNQLSLTRDQAARELDVARGLAARVAVLYGGIVQDLPGTGLIVGFPPTDNDDRTFHVLSAAFILSRLLADAASLGRYRLGLHAELLPPDETLTTDREAVREAAVLSALARDNGIVVSEAFHRLLPYNERLVSEVLKHPLLDELETTGGGARLARVLADPHKDLVEQRLAELEDQPGGTSTARESTF